MTVAYITKILNWKQITTRIDWLCGGCRGDPSGGHLSHGHGNPRRRHPCLERAGRTAIPDFVGTDPLPGTLPPDALLEEEAPGRRHHPIPVGGRTEEGKRKAPPVVAGRASQGGGEVRRLTPSTLLFIFFLFRILAPAIVVSQMADPVNDKARKDKHNPCYDLYTHKSN